MAGILVVWLWVWAGVSITTGTQVTKIQGHVPIVCEPGNALTEPSVTELYSATQIQCAMLCATRMAQKYTFNGTSCTLSGKTTLPASSTNTFFHFPSPDTLENIATGKVAYGSSIYRADHTADKAVDTDETDSSMFISASNDMSPWWQLDLGETRTIHEIQIITRQLHSPGRFHDVEIRVGEVYVANGDFSSYTLFATYVGPYTVTQGRLSCARSDGVRGRFVSIQKMKPVSNHFYLQIVDVNIFVRKRNLTV